MPLNLNPHEFATHQETGQAVLVKTEPYIRLSQKGEPPIFLQSGMAYTEGEGGIVSEEDWPDWMLSQMKNLKKKALEEVGFAKIVQILNASETEQQKKQVEKK